MMEAQGHRAGLVLAEEFNATFLEFPGPSIADSFVIGKIARTRDDQPRRRSIEKGFGAGFSGMVLAFNDNVAAKIRMTGQQRLFGFDASIRHEQDGRCRPDQRADDIRLIISDRRAQATWREQDVRSDLARQTETVSRSQSSRFDSAFLKETLQSPVNS